MVGRLEISEFNNRFENFTQLTPFARLCFLEIISRVEDEDFAGDFASGTLFSLMERCIVIVEMENGVVRSCEYFKLIGDISKKIRSNQEYIGRVCEHYALDYSFDDHSIFQISYAIAQYLITEISLKDGTELNDMCKYLENIRA